MSKFTTTCSQQCKLEQSHGMAFLKCYCEIHRTEELGGSLFLGYKSGFEEVVVHAKLEPSSSLREVFMESLGSYLPGDFNETSRGL